jgi:hypothetical protein
VQSFWPYLVLETKLLQDERGLGAVGCALCVERDVGLDTHDELLTFATVNPLVVMVEVGNWDIVWDFSIVNVVHI